MAAQDQDTDAAFVAWLRDRVEERGYALDGRARRAGGQSLLAAKAGVPQSVISRALSGRGKPSIETLIGLAHALDTDAAEMMERAGYTRQAQIVRAARSRGGDGLDDVLDRIEASGLPVGARRELASQYRRRLAQLDADILGMLDAVRASVDPVGADKT